MRIQRCRMIACVAGVLVLLVNGSSPAQQEAPALDTSTARQELLRLEERWLLAHDSLTLVRILGSDFVHPVASGDFLDRAQHIAWVVAHPPDPTVDRRLTDMRVRFYGATAIVTGTVRRSRSGSEVGRNVFTDVFVLRDGRWQAVSAEETPVATRDSAG